MGHETLRGHVQCMYRITAVPLSWSLVTQALHTDSEAASDDDASDEQSALVDSDSDAS